MYSLLLIVDLTYGKQTADLMKQSCFGRSCLKGKQFGQYSDSSWSWDKPWNYSTINWDDGCIWIPLKITKHMWPNRGQPQSITTRNIRLVNLWKAWLKQRCYNIRIWYARTSMRHFQHRRGVADELSRPRSRGRGKKYVSGFFGVLVPRCFVHFWIFADFDAEIVDLVWIHVSRCVAFCLRCCFGKHIGLASRGWSLLFSWAIYKTCCLGNT